MSLAKWERKTMQHRKFLATKKLAPLPIERLGSHDLKSGRTDEWNGHKL